LANARDRLVLNKAMDFPILRMSRIYSPNLKKTWGTVAALVFPVGLLWYFIGTSSQKSLKTDLKTAEMVCDKLIEMLSND
jgi:hypothetical protein